MDIKEQSEELQSDNRLTKLMSLGEDEKTDKIASDKQKLIKQNKHKFKGFDQI